MIRSGFAQGEHNTGGQGVPHLRPFNVTGDGRVDLTQVKYVAPPCGERVPWVCRGDVILNNTNSEDLVGKTAHFPLDGSYLLSNHMTLIRVLDSDSVDAYWLASRLHYEWTIGTFRSMLRRYVGQATVSLQRLRELVLPFPSVGEQRAIAETLRSVRQAKEATEAVIAATRQLKKSLMRHLFTSGPVPVQEAERVPLQETEIGPVPEHWRVVTLGSVAAIGNGSTPKRTNPVYWDGGTIPWLTSSKVHERTVRRADELVTQLARKECHLPLVPRGSIVVAITGQGKTLGNAALLALDACVSQHLAYLRFRAPQIVPEFVLAYLQWRYWDLRRASQAGGSTKGALTCGFLASYLLPTPPTGEQQRIARIVTAVDHKLEAEEKRKQVLEVLLNSLLRNLMTGKVRVPLAASG